MMAIYYDGLYGFTVWWRKKENPVVRRQSSVPRPKCPSKLELYVSKLTFTNQNLNIPKQLEIEPNEGLIFISTTRLNFSPVLSTRFFSVQPFAFCGSDRG